MQALSQLSYRPFSLPNYYNSFLDVVQVFFIHKKGPLAGPFSIYLANKLELKRNIHLAAKTFALAQLAKGGEYGVEWQESVLVMIRQRNLPASAHSF